MSAGIYNFTIQQGVTFSQTITVSGLSLTGKSARAQYRSSPDGTLLETFTCVVDGQNIVMSMAASVTAALTGSGQYDLEVYSGSPETVDRLLQGDIYLAPEVTK